MGDSEKVEVTPKSNLHLHLSTAFVAIGIVSFIMGIAVNYYTLKRLKK